MKTYKGKYRPKNTDKYSGDPSDITYRSLWERKVMEYCDLNPDIIRWNSEGIIIPYKCKTDNKSHRYYLDFAITFKDRRTILVEVKPNTQTKPPKQPKTAKGRNKYLKESLTYAKNVSKWQAAKRFAEAHGVEFHIWDEYSLESLGIRVVKPPPGKRKKQ